MKSNKRYLAIVLSAIMVLAMFATFLTATVSAANIAGDATIKLPDELYGGTASLLTDGIGLEEERRLETSVKFWGARADQVDKVAEGVVFSFDSAKEVRAIEVTAWGGKTVESGAGKVEKVTIWTSSDDAVSETTAWTEVASIDYDGTEDWQVFAKTLDAAVEAKHVKFTFKDGTTNNWIPLCIQEIAIFDSVPASTPTGDNGVVALGIVAFIALAGAAVCTKRNLNK